MNLFCAGIFLSLAFATGARAHEVDLTRLPLGETRISTEPKAGWIWACRVDAGGGGAKVNGPWIKADGTFDLTIKARVAGAVTWPHRFTLSVEDDTRVFASNDLPNHPTGVYPIAPGDPAFRYDRNPSHIGAQDIRVALPLDPVLLQAPLCTPGAVGILLTGVVLFNGLDAEGRDAVAHEVQDDCQGHPQVTATYHYHNVTSCIEDKRTAGGHSALVGYALDGFGIYGRYGEKGEPLASADLDVCHGHTHKIMWNGKLVEMYHYHGTPDFPYTVGCMRGAYSMRNMMTISGGPVRPPGGGGPGRPPGRPNLGAAAAKLGITPEDLIEALGPPPPDLAAAAKRLGISEQTLGDALGRPRGAPSAAP